MRKIKSLLIYLIFSLVLFGDEQPIGDLDINVYLKPYGTIKTYDMADIEKLVLDAGVINSKDGIKEQRIAEVVVNMKAKPTKEFESITYDACIIDGAFNGLLKIEDLKSSFSNEIPLTNLIKYNGGARAKLKLKASNYRIDPLKPFNPNPTDPEYLFSAYPEKCQKLSNVIQELNYKFDLVLDVENIEPGDIIRGDINLDSQTTKAISGKGALQDLIEGQMKSIMTERY